MSRSKHGRRRNRYRRSSPCSQGTCWICMSGAEKKRRIAAREQRKETSE